MGKVLFGLSVSLDGFIADTNDDVSLLDAFHLNIAPVLLGEGVSPLRSPWLKGDPFGTHQETTLRR